MSKRSIPDDVLKQIMSKELVFHLERRNFAVVQAIHMADAGPVAAVRQCGALADNVEWAVPGPTGVLPFAGLWQGIDGLWQLERQVNKAVRHDRVELTKYLVSGNEVAAVMTVEGFARTSGRPFRTEVIRVYTLNEGRIARITSAYDTAALVEAVVGYGSPAQPESYLKRA